MLKLILELDSQRVGSNINYVTAIAYRYPMRGVHYIYCKETFPPIKDDWSRLWLETERTMQIAEMLSNNLPGIRFEIDMDYNDDEFYMSNKLVSAAKGWATSFGYKVNIKPNKTNRNKSRRLSLQMKYWTYTTSYGDLEINYIYNHGT